MMKKNIDPNLTTAEFVDGFLEDLFKLAPLKAGGEFNCKYAARFLHAEFYLPNENDKTKELSLKRVYTLVLEWCVLYEINVKQLNYVNPWDCLKALKMRIQTCVSLILGVKRSPM